MNTYKLKQPTNLHDIIQLINKHNLQFFDRNVDVDLNDKNIYINTVIIQQGQKNPDYWYVDVVLPIGNVTFRGNIDQKDLFLCEL